MPVSRWNALSVLFHVRCAVISFFKIPSYKCQRGKTQYATHTVKTLSNTYKMDKDKAGHYDQMYKYGHIAQTVHLCNKKGKETWWNMQQKIMTYNWILSGHYTIKISFLPHSKQEGNHTDYSPIPYQSIQQYSSYTATELYSKYYWSICTCIKIISAEYRTISQHRQVINPERVEEFKFGNNPDTQHDRQCMCNVTLRCICATIVAMEKQ